MAHTLDEHQPTDAEIAHIQSKALDEQAQTIHMLREQNKHLVEKVKAFLQRYEDVSSELYFGRALDDAFCDEIEPLYDIVRKGQ